MNLIHRGFWIASSVIAALSIAAPALSGSVEVTLDVRDISGLPVSSQTLVSFRDLSGAPGICDPRAVGIFSCDTTGKTPPFLTMANVNGGPEFGYVVTVVKSGSNDFHLNSFVDLATNQAFFASYNKSGADEWSQPTPDVLSLPALASSNAAVARMLFNPMVDYSLSPTQALTLNFFNGKYLNGVNQLLTGITPGGVGNSTETMNATLPSGSIFNGTVTALPTLGASTWNWNVKGPNGAVTYQSAFSYYPTQSDAASVYGAAGSLFINYGNLIHKSKMNLTSAKLTKYDFLGDPTLSYLNNGNNASTQSEIDATFLRNIRLDSFFPAQILSLIDNYLGTGLTRIVMNALRFSTLNGVPCIDECCYPIVVDPTLVKASFLGNLRYGNAFQDFVSEKDYSSAGTTLSSYLKGGGLSPTGTLDPTNGYAVTDLDGIYPVSR
jgi:hypothetical protein